jgi:hypothetical protein
MSAQPDTEVAKQMAQAPPEPRHHILGFDSWTKGAHHFERLIPALARQGATLRLVHLGSWGNDPGRPRQERIGELEVRDIAYYGGASLERVLEVEAPDVVVLLSIETFAHRAMLRYCRRRSIPTLLLYHGLVNVQVTNDRRGSYGPQLLAHARFVGTKVGKVLRRTLPCYLTSLVRTRAGPGDWRRFIADSLRMALGRSAHRFSADPGSDMTATMCAVYTDADVEHAIRSYAFAPQSVRVVGNPDLGRFGMTEQMLGSRLAGESPVEPRIMYIDTGLVNNGLVFRNYDEFVAHLVRTAEAITAQGARMLLKLHPSHEEAALRLPLAAARVEIVANHEFMDRLRAADACIVEPTTLALLPGLLGLPMFYAAYGELSVLRYGPVLMSYPRGRLLSDIRELSPGLSELRSECDARATRAWIERNAGPIPIQDMPERVAGVVQTLCAQRPRAAAARGSAHD